MVYLNTRKYNKATAWFLFFVFYLQLISPVFANRLSERYFVKNYPTVRHHAISTMSYESAGNISINHLQKDSDPDESHVANNHANEGNRKRSFFSGGVDAMKLRSAGPGPTQPEMQSFQSVGTSNMVDLFTGDFTYNIPLMDVGGYPVNLHYSSGITMDQESSWVGLGWNINPGTINRNMRGLPDDFNGTDKVTKIFSMKPNKTIGVTIGGNAELLGKTVGSKTKASTLGVSLGVFHNTYNGWGTETGINTGINSGRGSKGNLSGALSITNNSQSGLDVSPSFSVRMGKEDAKTKGFVSLGTNYNSRIGIQGLQMTAEIRESVVQRKNEGHYKDKYFSTQGIASEISFATPSFTPGITIPFTSKQYSFTAKVGSEAWAFHPNLYVQGSYSKQFIAPDDMVSSLPAFGYLYYQEAANQEKVLLDFNREKEVEFRGTTPHIAIPGYTYDIYSVSGEGTGGMFRPYRGDIGMIYDHAMSTKSASDKISLDLGFGSVFHGGIDLNKVWANSGNNPWLRDNVMARYVGFKKQDSLYENVYFKNPGEKVTVDQSFYNKIGDDNLVRVQLSPKDGQNNAVVSATRNLTLFQNAKQSGTIALDASTYKTSRDKRTQVISYLTAKDASVAGLDRDIKSYSINSFPSTGCNTNYSIIKRNSDIRKPNHLSEITVLSNDGQRYVYGTPVYNIEQQDVSFAVDKAGGDNSTGLVVYDTLKDNTVANDKGKDNYFSEEIMPPYAHSFLLSGIVSSDYVDISGDGITEDDNGNAVKFNYSRIYGTNNPYRWRAPFDQNKASYNEGFKTTSRDDKGSYSYGQKEVWYMNSIESKTMIATFVLETDSVRQDSYGVKNNNGGLASAQKLYRLKQINLYTKADFLKNGGVNAKPIKSVHFEYSYELCNGVPSSNNTGKLTLKKVWFSFNKNYKGKLNPYTFQYHSKNPDFNNKSYDRWGNYKDPDDNPGAVGNTLTNGEYPYALQKGVKNWDNAQAANNVSAWTLNQIKLPSGGVMKVSYESDDYAYVQDRRAMQMFSIEGLGNLPDASPSSRLYQQGEKDKDYQYVFIRLNDAVFSRSEIEARYLEGVKKLYFKLFVKMPDGKDGGRWGTGYEQIPCFADIEDYGIKPGYANKMIWIRVVPLKTGRTPMATAAIQYLRLNHPGKAFPYSEPGDDVSLKDAIGMIASVGANISNSIDGFEDQARRGNRCNDIDPQLSLIRLNNPEFKKFGGGLRVKKIEIFDNWQKMTAQTEATYGQIYNYNTTKLVNAIPVSISSGVSSYEPVLGKEENPFYQPIEYAEKMAAFGPTDYVFTEEPLGESFFPAATVGYSKVTVQTINNTKKSANGLDVTEFFTAKEFPTIFENTPLDNDSKKTFANPIGNFFKFDAKRYVTLSQGFKVELNDMHGKVKSQCAYAQTDLAHPITSTINYYKLDNDNALNKHLCNRVVTADSANGVINNNAVIGKDVDMLIDIREQTSKTISGSVQLNLDVVKIFPPILIPSIPRLPTFETNRYRSIAVTKVVNRYAILDSVVHIDKGSKISTANMVYDGETGNVLLSRTQNEFDDPVYSFNYPAYWAYSGMEGAYKNVGSVFKNVQFLNGRMQYNGMTALGLERYFESGDEILLEGKMLSRPGNSLCAAENFIGLKDTVLKIWALDVSKGSGSAIDGIYFIDKNGLPVTAAAKSIKVIRSGKRNMIGVSAGSVTSLQSPVKLINGISRFVFDSTIGIINASAVKFKDFWKTDSSSYRKDTVMMIPTFMDPIQNVYYATEAFTMRNLLGKKQRSCRRFYTENPNDDHFFASARDFGGGDRDTSYKTWMRFDLENIPAGSIITNAVLNLPAPASHFPQYGDNNSATISRTTGIWIRNVYNGFNSLSTRKCPNERNKQMKTLWENTGLAQIDIPSRINVTATSSNNSYMPRSYPITNMANDMLSNFYNSNRKNVPAVVIDMVSPGDVPGKRMSFGFDNCAINQQSIGANFIISNICRPSIVISYITPCANGSTPVYSSTPVPGYYCASQPIDTFICKPNINDTATNPYRWGIWGNWQIDRAYTYYNSRKEDSVTISNSVTNIRKNGEIQSFMPFWSFTNTTLSQSQDSSRWVWNSEINLINSKGLELQNHDPLDRYNSAQYGYNQTLPVAVVQNSRNREMMYEGFEDYGYRTDTCKSCPSNRYVNLVAGGTLVDSLSHTGLYSLRVPGNQTDSLVVPLVSFNADTLAATVFARVDSTLIQQADIKGKGTGLTGTYSKWIMSLPIFGWQSCGSRIDSVIDFNWGINPPFPGCVTNRYQVSWTGYIQPRYSELYRFYATAANRMQIQLNGRRITLNSPIESTPGTYDLDTMTLIAGKVYPITIILNRAGGDMAATLNWSSTSQGKEIIPKSQLYTNTDTTGTTLKPDVWCYKLNSPVASKITLSKFSPLQGTKIVVGAWVKEKDTNADTVSSFRNVQIQLVFSTGAIITLKPSGNIIEGWQRIEDTLTIPAAAIQFKLRLMSTNSSIPVYFDDLRIHPYNSNLKSFVYNPINIRLMAELDENNYASFYEYDDDGTLIRVKKETERGVKTIKETRSALLKE
ncbi:MAG: hypothetical protein JWP81_5145 [Ferruginibacter sp.]|nr:hypothetical protein [Ferruginibacter sp.]